MLFLGRSLRLVKTTFNGEPLTGYASGTLAKVVGGNSQVEFSVKGFAPDEHIIIEMSYCTGERRGMCDFTALRSEDSCEDGL